MKNIWELKSLVAHHPTFGSKVSLEYLKIAAGEKVALVGPDPASRALLFRVLGGLHSFEAETFTFCEQNIVSRGLCANLWGDHFPPELRRKVGVAFEEEGHLANVSLEEGMELLFRFRYGDRSAKLVAGAKKVAAHLCQSFSLQASAQKRPFYLSPGQRRLGGIARAFLSKPQVLLLENPTYKVEDSEKDLLIQKLSNIFSEAERTVLLSTGDQTLAQKFCTRTIEIREGKIHYG